MTSTKFDELKDAIHTYGDAAFQNLVRCRALSEAIVEGLPAYLGCEPEAIAAVPIEGPFDPQQDYGDAAYSFHKREVIILEPVRFGLSLVVGNREDSGSMWLRTAIAIEITGDTFDVFVASRPLVRVPIEFESQLNELFETIFKEFLETFTLEVMEFNDARFKTGIGFIHNH